MSLGEVELTLINPEELRLAPGVKYESQFTLRDSNDPPEAVITCELESLTLHPLLWPSSQPNAPYSSSL